MAQRYRCLNLRWRLAYAFEPKVHSSLNLDSMKRVSERSSWCQALSPAAKRSKREFAMARKSPVLVSPGTILPNRCGLQFVRLMATTVLSTILEDHHVKYNNTTWTLT